MRRLIPIVVVLLLGRTAVADTIVSGTVFLDHDGDGVFGPGDEPVVGTPVVWETTVWAETDALGRYSLRAPRAGIVWARAPEGAAPGPAWGEVPASGEATVDLALAPRVAARPDFIHVSDVHLGNVDVAAATSAITQAEAMAPDAAFLVVTGDILSQTTDAEVADALAAFSRVSLPIVPIPGNHDWHDGGPRYRKAFGPPMYSFDCAGVHFLVLNFNAPFAEQKAFAAADLSRVPMGTEVALFTHVPLDVAEAAELEALGVTWAFTGHLHSNRVIDHDGLVEVNTESLAMGGIDYTPAGFRVVSLAGGELVLRHHAIVDEPVAALVHPGDGATITAGPLELVAAVEAGAPVVAVRARVDGGAPVELAARGGWSYAAPAGTLVPGAHTAELEVTLAGGAVLRRTLGFTAAGPRTPPARPGDWTQYAGSPRHEGRADTLVGAPLTTVWARPLGGHLRGGSVAVAGGRVFAPVVDLADGTRGGLVALDLATGQTLWERRTGQSVTNAPAVADGIVVFGTSDGTLHAVRADTGAPLWTFDAGVDENRRASWLYAAPAIEGDTVVIATETRLAALDLHTGAPRWNRKTGSDALWQGEYAPAAIGGGVVVLVASKKDWRVVALDLADGRERWTTRARLQLAPIIDGDTVILVDNSTHVRVLELATGSERRKVKLYGDKLGHEPYGAAVLDGRLLVVPTPNQKLYAVDVGRGSIRWTLAAGESPLRPVPYGVAGTAFLSAPALAGGLLWVAGADGRLRAVHPNTGVVLWSRDFGVPIVAGVVPAGEYLLVPTFDGTLHALVGAPVDPSLAPPRRTGACAAAPGGPPSGAGLVLLLVAIAAACRRPPAGAGRRARRRRSCARPACPDRRSPSTAPRARSRRSA
jgi:outer membrane protein assembly factor BamB